MASQENTDETSMPDIKWKNSIWFSDVDDTLIDTASTSIEASDGIAQVFSDSFGQEVGMRVQEIFNQQFALLMDGYRVSAEPEWQDIKGGKLAFDDLLSYFADCQKQVMNDFGHIKKWSREAFIKRAADLAGIKVTPELVHRAAEEYWRILTDRTYIFPDALQLAETIEYHDRPLFLVTSSDARLKMQDDGQFVYDPLHSESLKRKRLQQLYKRGIKFKQISIGDPEDKPSYEFFDKAISVARNSLGSLPSPDNFIMLGDSFGGDLQTPKEKMNFGLVVLRDEKANSAFINDTHQITVGNLTQVVNFIH